MENIFCCKYILHKIHHLRITVKKPKMSTHVPRLGGLQQVNFRGLLGTNLRMIFDIYAQKIFLQGLFQRETPICTRLRITQPRN